MSSPATAPAPAAAAEAPQAATLNVRTDVLDVDVSLQGGDLTRADLLEYPVVKGGTEPVRLLRNQGMDNQFLLQTGLAGAGGGTTPQGYPTPPGNVHQRLHGFRLEDGVDELRVPLKWVSPEGVTVTKTFIFRRGAYRVDVEYAVQNAGTTTWTVAPYAQIQHDMPPPKRSYFNVDSYSFTGPAYWNGTKYQKVKVTEEKAAEFNREYPDGWKDGWIALPAAPLRRGHRAGGGRAAPLHAVRARHRVPRHRCRPVVAVAPGGRRHHQADAVHRPEAAAPAHRHPPGAGARRGTSAG